MSLLGKDGHINGGFQRHTTAQAALTAEELYAHLSGLGNGVFVIYVMLKLCLIATDHFKAVSQAGLH